MRVQCLEYLASKYFPFTNDELSKENYLSCPSPVCLSWHFRHD